jgi:hypothetical protein
MLAVDDRGSKGDLTPLMDAASQGHVEIVKLLIGLIKSWLGREFPICMWE